MPDLNNCLQHIHVKIFSSCHCVAEFSVFLSIFCLFWLNFSFVWCSPRCCPLVFKWNTTYCLFCQSSNTILPVSALSSSQPILLVTWEKIKNNQTYGREKIHSGKIMNFFKLVSAKNIVCLWMINISASNYLNCYIFKFQAWNKLEIPSLIKLLPNFNVNHWINSIFYALFYQMHKIKMPIAKSFFEITKNWRKKISNSISGAKQ